MKKLSSYKYLIIRRITQFSVLFLFFMGNYANWKILQGNLSSSILFNKIPLSDPLAVLQLLLAGGALALNTYIGFFIVLVFYGLLVGRAFCAFVCPINMVTDLASWLHRYLGLDGLQKRVLFNRQVRYWALALTLILSFILGIPAFEAISPITIFNRGVIYGMGFGFMIIIGIFLFDFLVLKHGFCGHLCPLGAFYSLTGRFSLLKVAHDKEKCTLCNKCKDVCPERQVLKIIGLQSGNIINSECIKCARCIEVCDDDALEFNLTIHKGIKNEKK